MDNRSNGETTWNKLHIQSLENIYTSHHLQGAGAYCVDPTIGCTACLDYVFVL